MQEKMYYTCYSNNLCRYLVGRSYFYVFRQKCNDKFVAYFKKSPLLDELLTAYENDKCKYNTFEAKTTKRAI